MDMHSTLPSAGVIPPQYPCYISSTATGEQLKEHHGAQLPSPSHQLLNMLNAVFLAQFLPSWVCLHIPALKYLSISCYFLPVQSQALKIPAVLHSHTDTGTQKAWFTPYNENRK